MTNLTMQVYDGKTKAIKHVEKFNTADPEQCLTLVKAIFKAGGNITANMNTISREDKERLFDYLNDDLKFPDSRYTKQVDEIHAALAFELTI